MIDTKNKFVVITNKKASHQEDIIGRPRVKHSVLDPLIRLEVKDIEFMERPSPKEFNTATEFGRCVVVICGGDGTINWVLNNLPEDERKVVLLPLAFGGANDTSRSLYGYHSLEHILAKGNDQQAYSLDATLYNASQVNTVKGLGYISIGATALAAHELNKERQDAPLTRAQKYTRAANGMRKAKVFDYFDLELESMVSAYDIRIQNGRMAQVLRTPKNKGYFCDDYFDLVIAKNRREFIKYGALSMLASNPSNKISRLALSLPSETSTKVAIQADGETTLDPFIPPGSEVVIGHNGLVRVVLIN